MVICVIVPRNIQRKFLTGFLTGLYGQSHRCDRVRVGRSDLDLPTLQQRRQHSKIIMLYRIKHKLASIPTATYIAPSTRNTQHYILPYARTHVFKTSFFPSTINIWNNLQPVVTNSTTIPQLRQALHSTPTSGRHGAPCSAGSEWTPHAY